MKIELIGDNKVKYILSKKDLEARDLNLETLTYGSDQTKMLFKELIAYASSRFELSLTDSPVSVEAIPTSGENLVIIITKVEEPEELDTRFSKFIPTFEDIQKAVSESEVDDTSKLNKANEILNLLSSFKDALLNTAEQLASASTKKITGDNAATNNNHSEAPHTEPQKKEQKKFATLVFSFDNIDKIIALSNALEKKYNGNSSIYKKDDIYYLLINNVLHTPEEFNQICNIICEYGNHTNLNKNTEIYFNEHYELILKNTALEDLSKI